ncbi:Enoyl-CoA delta isomerase 1, peroxisomal [Yarrowia sp. B02]|nr:Enoyl-CoA delta isomerase 1, peroxisomal [Yarrowia sp. B02]
MLSEIFVKAMSVIETFPLPQKGQTERQQLLILSDKPDYYLLEFNNAPENRLTMDFIDAFVEALYYLLLKKGDAPKPLVTSSTTPKFYSNGLNWEQAKGTPEFFHRYLGRLQRALIEFPWPTIAHVNGHAFAGAFIVANHHDFKVMNPNKGWLCMNEIGFDASLQGPLMSVHSHQYGPRLARKIAMTGHRFTAAEALKEGLIDAAGAWPEVDALAKKIKPLVGKYNYRQMRMAIFAPVLDQTKNFYHYARLDKAAQREADDFRQEREDDIKAKL